MSQTINANRLFLASCFALITTAFSFSIRAGILTQLGTELNLDPVQLGHINQMWFLGFPISMILGGILTVTIVTNGGDTRGNGIGTGTGISTEDS